ncbi:MAG: IPTL-CTERM sorting domain-containing protein [Candidatus Dadabacteria bacterium]|nr:IPTL-CTERM sorting domain-containing protein [Candidatus Dadabacteria bacterium]
MLTIPGTIFGDGIILFTGSVSSLSVSTDSPTSSAQSLTFAILPPRALAAIPTLSEWGLMAAATVLGITGLIVTRRRMATA